MKKTNYRIAWIDISKGIAILLVLLGHGLRDDMRTASPALDLGYRLIYIFHMSFFFFISGYVYEMNKIRFKRKYGADFIISRLKKLILPWGLYALFIYAAFFFATQIPKLSAVLVSAGFSKLSLLSYTLKTLQANNPYAYHLWFIYILFIVSLAVFIFDKLASRKTRKPVLALIALLSVGALIPLNYYEAYFGDWRRLLNYIALYLPFFVSGILLYGIKLPKGAKYIWYAAGLAYIIIRAKFFSGFSGNSVEAPTMEYKLVIIIAAYVFLPGAFLLLCDLSERLTAAKPLKAALSLLGKKSFVIYLFHQPFCCAFLGLILYSKLHLPAGVSVLICIGASLFAAFAVDFIYTKTGRFILKGDNYGKNKLG